MQSIPNVRLPLIDREVREVRFESHTDYVWHHDTYIRHGFFFARGRGLYTGQQERLTIVVEELGLRAAVTVTPVDYEDGSFLLLLDKSLRWPLLKTSNVG